MSDSMPQGKGMVILAGCGYTGRRAGILWQEAGYRVWCLVRSKESAARAERLGLAVVQSDLDTLDSLPDLPSHHAIICYFVPPPAREHDTRLQSFLLHLEKSGRPKTILYISTSGVYGDTKGRWVTEDTPLHPETNRAKRRVDAENILRSWAAVHAVWTVILRVPAISGPHRLPVQRIREKIPILQRKEAPYSNRIHVDDLAYICLTAALNGNQDAIYNVSDGDPRKVTDYYFTLADMLGLDRPPTISMEEAVRTMSPRRLSFLRESRRIRNRNLLDSLGISLRYPTLEAGLTASLKAMNLIP